MLSPGLEVSEGSFDGGCRLVLPLLSDIVKARTAIMTSYQWESERKAEDAGADVVEA